MEKFEGVFDSIKKWLKIKASPTSVSAPEVLQPPLTPGWNYQVYREYLLAASRGREFLLPIEEYPALMELNQPWHEAFNQLRQLSVEGWILIGFEEGQRRLVLPRATAEGLSHSVPNQVILHTLNEAKVKAGITDLVGDIHHHPSRPTHPSWLIPSVETSEGAGFFSLGDLHGFLRDLGRQGSPDSKKFVMFIVEGNENIAAFATRRTLDLIIDNPIKSYGEFAKQWYEKFGWVFKGRQSSALGGGEIAEPVGSDAAGVWQINKAIAHHYQIALYRGFKDGPLLRDYPARVTVG